MHAPRPPGPIVDLTRERWIYYRFRRPGERPAWPTRSSGRMAQPPSPRTAPSSEEGLRGAFSSPYSSTLAFSPSTCPPLLGGLRRKGTLPTSTGVHRDGDGRALGATRSATSCAAPLRMRTEV
ncbi:unnamed protein product [Prorocentrum cordatum]|uniref:Uncharacterized protein n=1 Tax=Prorocentrum cordatum TaxID=2364126 RepID=A0ABN9VPL3_9DINO|nr:unnamed protein product [Polarella glacialis]